ncbi:hypothetical protein FJV76_22550 [Mesorhizobium sp. WSM4303]|uniref:hypothetical protein n=1 Tax=unclassified Mesorhizobium TaxID=325217 RepID=UPI00115E1B68|nr:MULTISPECIES: hypothetical protein [unclassified Mesorhizobium]TRC92789.1 hypothetical protein FJV77_24325 [Mesorhizobium sp. WSM4306]TRD01292.1 hypothetical protein FJV76_22550 [Mesorhizobium sp. WSM4303]
MSQRAFIILLILLAALVAPSATSFAGAMIGFLIGITVAFFIAMPGAAIGYALNRAGVPVTGEQLVWAAGGLYAVFVLAAAVQAWLRLRRGDMDGARSAALRMAILMALPLIAWLSLNAMQRNWP